MVGLVATSPKRAYATGCVTQVCCTQSSCPCSRPLLTCTPTGDTQTLKGRSGSVSVGSLGPGMYKVLFEPSEHLWWVWGFILNMILPLLPPCGGFSFAFGCGGISLKSSSATQPLLQCHPSCWGFSILGQGVSPQSQNKTQFPLQSDSPIRKLLEG